MTYDDAAQAADRILTDLLRSGDPALFAAATGPDGRVDTLALASAAAQARPELIAKLMAGEI